MVWHEVAYTEFTSNVTISGTTEAGATTIVTAAAVTFSGSAVALVEFFSPAVVPGAADAVTIVLFQDGVTLGHIAEPNSVAGTPRDPVFAVRRLTPASGSRTYSVRAYRNSANGTVEGGAGGSGNPLPGYIRILQQGG